MELDLTSFSTTLAVGLALALVTYFGLRSTYPAAAEHIAQWLGADSPPERKWLPLLGTGLVLLGIGLLCEDISKSVLGEVKPNAFATQLQAVLKTEKTQRCQMIVESPDCDPAAKRSPAPDDVVMKDLGFRVVQQLANLTKFGIATPEEASLHALLSTNVSHPACKQAENRQKQEKCVAIQPDLARELPEVSSRLYYVAKNTVYTNEIYQSELESFRVRYGFERSIAFVLVVGIYVACFLFLAKSAVAMWTDVGGWKTIFSVVLLILLILTLCDIVTGSAELRTVICGQSDRACERRVDLVRTWILPATLIFVVGYRVRRVGKKLGGWLNSSSSTIPGPPLLIYEREIEAWRVLRLVAILAALLVPTSWVYHAEQNYYLGRVFGYYETQRGAALECTDAASCKKKQE